MALEKLTITRAVVSDTDKNGNKLINRNGKPYFKVGIKTNEYGDTWINGLMPFNPDKWEKTQQELEVFDEEYNGKTTKKFKLPARENRGGMSNEQYQILLTEIRAVNTNILRVLTAVSNPNVTSAGTKVPDFSEVEDRKKEIEQKNAPDNSLSDEELASLDEIFSSL